MCPLKQEPYCASNTISGILMILWLRKLGLFYIEVFQLISIQAVQEYLGRPYV